MGDHVVHRTDSHVYLARHGDMAKIGVTRRSNPQDRIGDFVPKTRMLWCAPMQWVDAIAFEKVVLDNAAYIRLAHHQKYTEWFRWLGTDSSLVSFVLGSGEAEAAPVPPPGFVSAVDIASSMHIRVSEILASIHHNLFWIDLDGFAWVDHQKFIKWLDRLRSDGDSVVSKKSARTAAKQARGIHEPAWRGRKNRSRVARQNKEG